VPGSHVHGLAFGVAFPGEQRKYPIACLGSSMQVRGDRVFVYLFGHDVARRLGLFPWVGGWHLYRRFLGVQEVSAA
jgi:hypothetical protein